jgi:hypothetical protein
VAKKRTLSPVLENRNGWIDAGHFCGWGTITAAPFSYLAYLALRELIQRANHKCKTAKDWKRCSQQAKERAQSRQVDREWPLRIYTLRSFPPRLPSIAICDGYVVLLSAFTCNQPSAKQPCQQCCNRERN